MQRKLHEALERGNGKKLKGELCCNEQSSIGLRREKPYGVKQLHTEDLMRRSIQRSLEAIWHNGRERKQFLAYCCREDEVCHRIQRVPTGEGAHSSAC